MVEFELHFNVMKHFGRQDSGMRDKIKGSFITELMKTAQNAKNSKLARYTQDNERRGNR